MRRRYVPPMTRGQKAKLLCFLTALCLVAVGIVGSTHLKNLLSNLAVTRVTNTVNRVVMDAVRDTIASGEIQYDKLITFEKDASGGIAALQSNMAEFNRLQSVITDDILSRLGQVSETRLSIPLGTLSGSALLAGRGPSFTVRMQSIGSCSAHFENAFAHAGINQTTHSILLWVDVSVSILLPGFRTYTKVSNSFSVAETVIVGDVPESYTYFDGSEPLEDIANDYIMNNA